MKDLLRFDGLPVVETKALPTYPDHKADARRIVRHGLTDVLYWLGEKVGPAPSEPTHIFATPHRIFASAELVERLQREASNDAIGWPE